MPKQEVQEVAVQLLLAPVLEVEEKRQARLRTETLVHQTGAVSNVGGCLGPEHRDAWTGAAWARVATVHLAVTGRSPVVSLGGAPASSPFVGISVLGVDWNVDSSLIQYGGIDLRLRGDRSGHRRDNEKLRATDGGTDGWYEGARGSATQRRGGDGR